MRHSSTTNSPSTATGTMNGHSIQDIRDMEARTFRLQEGQARRAVKSQFESREDIPLPELWAEMFDFWGLDPYLSLQPRYPASLELKIPAWHHWDEKSPWVELDFFINKAWAAEISTLIDRAPEIFRLSSQGNRHATNIIATTRETLPRIANAVAGGISNPRFHAMSSLYQRLALSFDSGTSTSTKQRHRRTDLATARPSKHGPCLSSSNVPALAASAPRIRCDVCSTQVADRRSLTRHLKSVHGPRIICRVSGCLSTFARKDALVKHMRNHHAALEHSERPSPDTWMLYGCE